MQIDTALLLFGQVIQVEPGPLRREGSDQRGLVVAAVDLTGGHHHDGVPTQADQQLLGHTERLSPGLIQPIHHQDRRRGTVLDRPLELPDQLARIAAGRLGCQDALADQLISQQVGGSIRGQPPGMHMGLDRPLTRINMSPGLALGN